MIWNDYGLNIFLSVKVSDLPKDLFLFSPHQLDKTLCLVGNGGQSLWEKLPHPINLDLNPFDEYSVNQMKKFAKEYLEDDIEIYYPNDSYTLPLQRIGRFLNLCSQSPIGLDISEEFGLWFAFRGVFLTSKNVSSQKIKSPPTICTNCVDRECLNFSDLNQARLNCPVKIEHQYSNDQIKFHQKALNNQILSYTTNNNKI